jgi:antirestriction protein ArdC
MSKQIYAEVTKKIVAQLEAGVVPWVRPWSQTAGGKSRWYPHNMISNRDYNGINVVLLAMIGQQYPTGAWATYKQIKDAGGQVRKGEKGTQIVYFGILEVEDKKSDELKKIRLLRYFTVFNHAQADWEKDPLEAGARPDDDSGDDIPEAAATIKATGAMIRHGGNRAFYVPATDVINMPPKKAFDSVEHYFATTFHELTHWTGSKKRLDRDLTGLFGGKSYAFEELVAELGAAFLCATHSINGELRHAEYLGHWIKGLKDDDQAIFKAAALAQKAADFILGVTAEQQQEAA